MFENDNAENQESNNNNEEEAKAQQENNSAIESEKKLKNQRENENQQKQEKADDKKPKKVYVRPKRAGFFGILFHMVRGFFTAVGFGVVVLFVLFCFLIYSALDSTEKIEFPKQKTLSESVVKKGGGPKVLVVDLNGIILGDGSYASSEGTIEPLIKQLRYAADTPQIRGVVLQVSSGGGGLTASDILYNEIKNIRSKGKVVVASVGAMAASGAYYTIAPCDHIVISPTGMTGSFGVIMNRMNFKELMKKIGIEPEPIKSTKLKDLGSPFRDLTEEEKAYFDKILQTYHNRFVNIISEGRDIELEKVKALASGKLFTADESIDYKLADSKGYFEDALKKVEELAEIEDATIVRYKNPYPWMKFFEMQTKSGFDEKKLAKAVVESIMSFNEHKTIDAK